MGNVGTSITDVAVHLSHDTNVLVAVEQGVLVVLDTIATAMSSLVRLETRIGQDDDKTLGVLVGGGDGDGLLGDQLR